MYAFHCFNLISIFPIVHSLYVFIADYHVFMDFLFSVFLYKIKIDTREFSSMSKVTKINK